MSDQINHSKTYLLNEKNDVSIWRFQEFKSILESINTPVKSREEIINIWDSITDSSPYKKLHRTFFDYGIFKYAGEEAILRLAFGPKDLLIDMDKFFEGLKPNIKELCNRIKFVLVGDKPGYSIFEDNENVMTGKKALRCDIHIDTTPKECLRISKEVLKKWIELNTFEEGYKTDFFRFWTTNYLFESSDIELNKFEIAFVEWMKTASSSDIDAAYTEFIHNAKGIHFVAPGLLSKIDKGMKDNNITFPGIEGVRISSDLIR
jgi:hypothetical protein